MAIRNKIYYPKSHIVENLYTAGKEWMTEDGTEYIGYYHRYIDGKVASGAVYVRSQSVKLIKYVNVAAQPDNAVYNTLIKLSGTVFAASCTYLIPIVAIGWGLFDGEVINSIQLLAVIAIIGGIWMINSSDKAKNTETYK